jgi:tripartite-type tricarboxylate transporter receptor subunit TctC
MRRFSTAGALNLVGAVLIGLYGCGGIATVNAASRYPDKPVRIVLPFGPGGVADVTMRLVAQKLGERMGHNFIIDNRPGAGGIIATKAVLASPADGYTLYLGGNGTAISQSLFTSLPYNVLTDFSPVAGLAEFEILLAARTGYPQDTVQKLVAYAKENPGKLNLGTVARGSTQNLSAELFKQTTRIDATIVTFRTTPELVNAILRGDIDVGFDYYAAFRPTVTSKQLMIIAASGDQASEQLHEVPLVKDSGYPDYVVTSWNALWGPTGILPNVVQTLNSEVTEILKMPDIRTKMADFGMKPMILTPEQLAARMREDIKKWAAVIDKAGIPKQ